MTNYDVIQVCTLIEIAARTFREHMAQADLIEGQSKQPIVAVPGQQPPSPMQMQGIAHNLRMEAEKARQLIVSLVSSNFMRPAPEPELKLAGRMADLNGKAS